MVAGGVCLNSKLFFLLQKFWVKMQNLKYAADLLIRHKDPSINHIIKYSTTGPVMKGVIAKRIPAYVELKEGKTYSWCSCGLSRKQPFCDGSHKTDPSKLEPVRFTVSKDGRYLLCRCKQTNNRPYCDLTHVKTFIPESIRKKLDLKL